MLRKPKKPKKPKKKTLSAEQRELNRQANAQRRRIMNYAKKLGQQQGVEVDPSFYEMKVFQFKKATPKTIERLKAYTPEKIKNSNKITYKVYFDDGAVIYKGRKGAALRDERIKEVKKQERLEKRYKRFWSDLGIYTTKIPKIEQWKNPLSRKKLIDPSTGKQVLNADGTKARNKVKLHKDYFTETHVSDFGDPNNIFDDDSYRSIMDDLGKMGKIIEYATGKNPFANIPTVINQLRKEKGDEQAYHDIMDNNQIPPPYMIFHPSTVIYLTKTNLHEVSEVLLKIGLITEMEKQEVEEGIAFWREGAPYKGLPNDLIPKKWIIRDQ